MKKKFLSVGRTAYLLCIVYQVLFTLSAAVQSHDSALKKVYTTTEDGNFYHTELTSVLPMLLLGGFLVLALELTAFLFDAKSRFVKLLTPIFLLLGTGVVFQPFVHPQTALRHLLCICIGLVFCGICFFFSSLSLSKREFRCLLWLVIGFSFLAVLVCLVFRHNRTAGLWGELAKLVSIYLCAVCFPHIREISNRRLFFAALFSLLISVLAMRDFGTAAVLAAVLLCAMLYVSPFLALACGGIGVLLTVLGVFALYIFHPTSYLLTRITSCGKVLLDSEANGNFRTLLLSLIRAGALGTGFSPADTHYAFYSFASQHDFVFLSLAATCGIGIALLVLGCFISLALECCNYASARSNRRITAINMCGFFLTLQSTVSILGQLNLIPLTGIPIPFLGYGGSSMVTCLGVIGIALSARLTVPERGSIEYLADRLFDCLPPLAVPPCVQLYLQKLQTLFSKEGF